MASMDTIQTPPDIEVCDSVVGTKMRKDQQTRSISPGDLSSPTDNRPARRRRARTMFDDQAILRMETVFTSDQYPDIALREQLAEELAVSEARIQTWFQNKRSRTKRHTKIRNGLTEDKQDANESQKSLQVHVQAERTLLQKPIARVPPKAGRQIINASRNSGIKRSCDSDQGDIKHHIRKTSTFTPFYRELSPQRTEKVNTTERLVCKKRKPNSPQLSQPLQTMSYAPMFDAADGKYYLQPFANFQPFYHPVHPGMNAFLTSPPAGSIAPTSATMMPYLAAMTGSQSMLQPACHFPAFPHLAGRYPVLPTHHRNSISIDKHLSSKYKLSSVAWLASSHKKELNFDDASSTGDDHHSQGSTASPETIQKDDEEIDICG